MKTVDVDCARHQSIKLLFLNSGYQCSCYMGKRDVRQQQEKVMFMFVSRHRRLVLLVVTCFVMLCAGGFAMHAIIPDTRDAYRSFCYSNGRCECQMMDPLILAGDNVIPLVIEGIRDTDMPRRRYAIAFLGNAKAADALPVLRDILYHSGEELYLRADALKAMAMIDLAEGVTNARVFQEAEGMLGSTAERILSKDRLFLGERRTYWDAFIRRKD